MTTVNLGTTLYVSTCSECGIAWGIPDAWDTKRRDDHKTFYCPNGHSQYYPKESDAERYRRLLRAEQDELVKVRDEKAALERRLHRAKRGVCPVKGCGRTFANVALHVASKHPAEIGKPAGKK